MTDQVDPNENKRKRHVGLSYIGSKETYRIVAGPKDYRPMCFHKHATEEEALACPEANEALDNLK